MTPTTPPPQNTVAATVDTAPYQPQASDPPALLKVCPVCGAQIGSWCGGVGDIHAERTV